VSPRAVEKGLGVSGDCREVGLLLCRRRGYSASAGPTRTAWALHSVQGGDDVRDPVGTGIQPQLYDLIALKWTTST